MLPVLLNFVSKNNINVAADKLFDRIVTKIPVLIIAIIILIVGRFLINLSSKLIHKYFEKRQVDFTIREFVASILKFVLYALLILTVANTLGIQTTSFIAVLSAFGLAVGMALQGSLSNFAGGVLILVFRPFEVGDSISSSGGADGEVEEIDLLYTTLTNGDGIRIFVPNGALANSVIKNFTKVTARRLQIVLNLSYNADLKHVKQTIEEHLMHDNRIQKDPQPKVFVSDLNNQSIVLTIQVWTQSKTYANLSQELPEQIKAALDRQNIELSYAKNEFKITQA